MKSFSIQKFSPSLCHPALTVCGAIMLMDMHSHPQKVHSEQGKILQLKLHLLLIKKKIQLSSSAFISNMCVLTLKSEN